MTTNAEVIGFLLQCLAIPDGKSAKEAMALMGVIKRLTEFDRSAGEFERITQIDFSKVNESGEVGRKAVLHYYSIWDAELEIVLDYLEDNFWLIS